MRSFLIHWLITAFALAVATRVVPGIHVSSLFVLLVSGLVLGAVNAVRMSVDAFAGAPIVVVLNRYDQDDAVHHGNRDWLRDRDGYDVVTGPETAAARIVP